eukprot:COSAG01_NODE_89_length_27311_cov_22.687061_12_plen_482_part_00
MHRAALVIVAVAVSVTTAAASCTLTNNATKACSGTCAPHQLVEHGCVTLDGNVEGNWSTCTRAKQQVSGNWADIPFYGSGSNPRDSEDDGYCVIGTVDAPQLVDSLRSVTGHFRLHHYGRRTPTPGHRAQVSANRCGSEINWNCVRYGTTESGVWPRDEGFADGAWPLNGGISCSGRKLKTDATVSDPAKPSCANCTDPTPAELRRPNSQLLRNDWFDNRCRSGRYPECCGCHRRIFTRAFVTYGDMKTPDGRTCAEQPVYHGGTLRFPRLETVGGDFQIVSRQQALPMELDFTALRSVGGNFDPHNYLSMTKTFANLTTVGGHALFGHRPCLVPRELAGYECPSAYGDMGADPSAYTAVDKLIHYSEYTRVQFGKGSANLGPIWGLRLAALQHVGGTLWLGSITDIQLPALVTVGSLIVPHLKAVSGRHPNALPSGLVVSAPLLREVTSTDLRLGGPVVDRLLCKAIETHVWGGGAGGPP